MRAPLSLIAVMLSSTLFAQGYIWALPFSSTTSANVNRICASSFGIIYSTGAFGGTTDFDPGPGTTSVTSAGMNSGYIAKQQTSGALRWVIPLIGGGYVVGTGLALDKAENIYACGGFDGTPDFDPGPGTYTMNAQTYNDGYVCKYDSAGQLIWAKQFGEAGKVFCRSVSIDAFHNVYVTGHFQYTADFDPGPGTHLLTATGNTDGYLMKLDPFGNLLWVSRLYNSNQLQCINMVYDGVGNLYIAGSFNDTVDFDPGPGTAFAVADMTFHDGFIVKYDTSGNYVWSGTIGSNSSHELCYDVALDPSGKLLVAGKFNGPSDFDLSPGVSVLTPIGTTDGFLAKYDTSGGLIWRWQAGGSGSIVESVAITIDPAGNIYSCGRFNDTVDFDNGPGTWTLQSGSIYTTYVARHDSSGVLTWAGAFDGTSGTTSAAGSICMDSLGTILYTGGTFDGTTDFDPDAPVAQLTSTGIWGDAYIQKMTCTGSTSVDQLNLTSCSQVFPNPSTGEMTLQMCDRPNGPIAYSIYDTQGKLVATEKLPGLVSQQISLKELAPGFYTMQIVSGDRIETIKLVLN